MKTLLVIHGWVGADDVMKRHKSHYHKAGCDIMIVGHLDAPCWRPDDCSYIAIGQEGYISGDRLPRRLISTFRFFLNAPSLQKYSDCCIIEYDCLFFKSLPVHPGGFVTHLAGGQAQGCKGHQFFHSPWWANRETASKIVTAGDQMILDDDIENGSPDCFIGWLIEKNHIPFSTIPVYSRNTIHGNDWILEAQQAIKNGVTMVHGVKSEHVFKALSDI